MLCAYDSLFQFNANARVIENWKMSEKRTGYNMQRPEIDFICK